MRASRIARPGAIYDAAAAVQTFPDGGVIGDLRNVGWVFSEMGEGIPIREKEEDPDRMSGCDKFTSGELKGANKANLI